MDRFKLGTPPLFFLSYPRVRSDFGGLRGRRVGSLLSKFRRKVKDERMNVSTFRIELKVAWRC